MKGFTILELLVVAIIVTIIAVVAVPLYQGYVASSRTTDVINAFKAIELEVVSPAVARTGPVICDDSLVKGENLHSDYVHLSIGSTGPGYPTLNIGASANNSDGIRVARDFLAEMKTERGTAILPGAMDMDSLVAFSLQLSNQTICDVSVAALTRAPNQSTQASSGSGKSTQPVLKPSVNWSFSTKQPVMRFADSGTGSVITNGKLKTGDMENLAVEFNTIGGKQVAEAGIHGATFLSYGRPGNENEFYVWKPSNLTVRIAGHEYATGIDTTADTDSHRYAVLWSADGSLNVLVDGEVKFTKANVAPGYKIPGGGTIALAQDQDHYAVEDGTGVNHGFSTQDAYHGTIFSTALANRKVNPSELANAPLGSALGQDPSLVLNIQMEGNGVQDTTGNHQLTTVGDVSSHVVEVDTDISIPNPGATLELSIDASASGTSRLTTLQLTGLLPGTAVSDTDGNSGSGPVVDLLGWKLDSVTAVLPKGVRQNMNIGVVATATDVMGQQVTEAKYKALIMDPNTSLP